MFGFYKLAGTRAAADCVFQARCGRHASAGAVSSEDGASGVDSSEHVGPAANPGLLSEHERSVLLALMLLRQTVRCPLRWSRGTQPCKCLRPPVGVARSTRTCSARYTGTWEPAELDVAWPCGADNMVPSLMQGQSTHVLQELLDRPPVQWQSHKKWKMKDHLQAMA